MSLWAQPMGRRFIDPVFSGIRVTKNVKYGENLSFTQTPTELFMDIYEPVGDTMAKRPVIILFHAGSFLPPSFAGAAFGRTPIGTREDSGIVALCKQFAARGYVAISATHRLGWNPQAQTQEQRAQSIIQAVWRAVQDARALVRYLRKDAATVNQWRIDPDRIVMGGSSSGGYVGLHVAYLNLPQELDNPKFKLPDGTMFVDTTAPGMDRGSGANAFEGGSGNPGFPSNIHAVLNLGGALGDTSFIQNEDIPVISLHGVQDQTTPYTAGIVNTAVGNYPIIEVFGSRSLTENLVAKGNQTALLPDFATDTPFVGVYGWAGAGFEPFGWYSNSTPAEKARALRYVDTVLWFAGPRLFKALNLPTIQQPTVPTIQIVENIVLNLQTASTGGFTVYPNPAPFPLVSIEHPSLPLQRLELYRLTGEKVGEATPATQTTHYVWELPSDIAQGLYILRIQTPAGSFSQRWSYTSP